MTCPACGNAAPAEPVAGDMAVCAVCARSLVLGPETCRLATDSDVLLLSDGERTVLKAARPATWRADVKARKTALMGGGAR